MEGTNKAHENGEAMGLVGVRLTAQLGHGAYANAFLPPSLFLFGRSCHQDHMQAIVTTAKPTDA